MAPGAWYAWRVTSVNENLSRGNAYARMVFSQRVRPSLRERQKGLPGQLRKRTYGKKTTGTSRKQVPVRGEKHA